MKDYKEMLAKNDFEKLAEEIRTPENRTNTIIKIDLSTGECFADILSMGEWREYDSETIIDLLRQRDVPYDMRTAEYIRNKADNSMRLYHVNSMDPKEIQEINWRGEYGLW